MEKASCPQRILDYHNEAHAVPGSMANQLIPGMAGAHLTEGDCALEAIKCASSEQLHDTMNKAKSCHDLGKCILDRAALANDSRALRPQEVCDQP